VQLHSFLILALDGLFSLTSATLPLARKFPQLTKEDARLASETVWSFGEKEKYIALVGIDPWIICHLTLDTVPAIL